MGTGIRHLRFNTYLFEDENLVCDRQILELMRDQDARFVAQVTHDNSVPQTNKTH